MERQRSQSLDVKLIGAQFDDNVHFSVDRGIVTDHRQKKHGPSESTTKASLSLFRDAKDEPWSHQSLGQARTLSRGQSDFYDRILALEAGSRRFASPYPSAIEFGDSVDTAEGRSWRESSSPRPYGRVSNNGDADTYDAPFASGVAIEEERKHLRSLRATPEAYPNSSNFLVPHQGDIRADISRVDDVAIIRRDYESHWPTSSAEGAGEEPPEPRRQLRFQSSGEISTTSVTRSSTISTKFEASMSNVMQSQEITVHTSLSQEQARALLHRVESTLMRLYRWQKRGSADTNIDGILSEIHDINLTQIPLPVRNVPLAGRHANNISFSGTSTQREASRSRRNRRSKYAGKSSSQAGQGHSGSRPKLKHDNHVSCGQNEALLCVYCFKADSDGYLCHTRGKHFKHKNIRSLIRHLKIKGHNFHLNEYLGMCVDFYCQYRQQMNGIHPHQNDCINLNSPKVRNDRKWYSLFALVFPDTKFPEWSDVCVPTDGMMTPSEIDENEIDNGLFPGYDFVDTADLGAQDDSSGPSTFALPFSSGDTLMQWTSNLSGAGVNTSSGNSSSVQEELDRLRTLVDQYAGEVSALRTLCQQQDAQNAQQNATIQVLVQDLFQIRNTLHALGVVVPMANNDPAPPDTFDLRLEDFLNLPP